MGSGYKLGHSQKKVFLFYAPFGEFEQNERIYESAPRGEVDEIQIRPNAIIYVAVERHRKPVLLCRVCLGTKVSLPCPSNGRSEDIGNLNPRMIFRVYERRFADEVECKLRFLSKHPHEKMIRSTHHCF